jgi:type IV pilus assembly protein PilC
MPTFAYKARAANGTVVSGVIDAPEEKAAFERLKAQKLSPLEVGRRKAGGLLGFLKSSKIPTKEIAIFSRQLATLNGSGVPIVQGLSILESQMQSKAFREVIAAVRADIEGGLSISESLKKHPNAFSKLYISMIKAGETGGLLNEILERLSVHLEKAEALKAKIKSAMMYPVVILVVCSSITIFLLVWVIPRFKVIFASFGQNLPALTQMVLDASDWLRSKWYVLIALGFAAVWGFKRFYATEQGRRWVDEKMLKLPMFGILLKKSAVAQFTRTLGTLLSAGVSHMQALETVAETAGNVVISRTILDARDSIRDGGKLSDPLKKSGVFPPMVTSMITVGEETGGLDKMLTKVADFYDLEVDEAVKGLSSMIEPIVIVVMGVIVGFIVIAMYMPIFNMGELASKT